MQSPSVWAEWDPTHPDSLKRRPDDRRIILAEDLIPILEGTPDCVPDALLRDYLLRALRGELRRSRGRQPSKLSVNKLLFAEQWIKLEAEEIRAERAARPAKRLRGELEPTLAAANRVASRFGNITGKSLLNSISGMKNPGI